MSANWVSNMPSSEAYMLNRILYDVQHDRDEERRFFADPSAYIAGFPALTARAAAALSGNDVGKLYTLGANPYLLRAYCLQLRVPEADYLAALRAVGTEADNG